MYGSTLARLIGRDVQWEVAKARLVLNIERDVLCGRLEKLIGKVVYE